MEIAKLVLEYLKAFLTPTFVGGCVVVFTLLRYDAQFKTLINRIWRVKFPGGEFETSQIEKAQEDIKGSSEPLSITKTEEETLPENLTLTPEQLEIVTQHINAANMAARLWEYRFLNFFLARASQRVLDWLAALDHKVTTTLFDSIWLPIIPSLQERVAIIHALENHYLITCMGELIEVTPKGREYIEWRGPLPADPT